MRSGMALIAAVAALLLTACDVTTVSQSFDSSLIRQVGQGSNAVASIVPTIRASTSQATSFTNPQTAQATVLLFQGQLSKLSNQDLIRMANANQASSGRLSGTMARLAALASGIAADRIDPSAHSNLSSGAKQFIAAWNAFLDNSVADVRSLRQMVASTAPMYTQFQSLLRAAYATGTSHSVTQFDQVRKTFLTDMAPLYARLQSSVKAMVAPTPASRHLVEVVNNSQEARAIVAKVNQEYPHGVLATGVRS